MDERSEDDDALLDSHLSGDSKAFEELVRRHEDRVYSLSYRMMGNEHDALDATQETFVNAFRRASTFKRQSSFGTWLYRVGINTCLDQLRSRNRLPVATEQLPDNEGASASDSVDVRLDLAAALALLPAEFREPMLLHDVIGIPYDEIAAQSSISLGTVKSRISRGRRKLATLLEHQGSSQTSKGSR